MKNSDMKVIAIILSIALLFTIITSNAVSVISVIKLMDNNAAVTEDGTATDGTATGNVATGNTSTGNIATGNTATGSTATGNTATGNTATGNTATGNTATGNTATGNTATGNTATGNTGAADNAGDAAADTANDPVIADPFAFYSKAANDIHMNGTAGYKKISWQTPIKIEGLGLLDSVIVPILEGFMTTEDEATVKDCAKGSDDAKSKMPASNCSKQYIVDASATKEGDNYVVTIVVNGGTNPSYDDPDGLQLMSREFLDYKDVEKEAKNIAVVKSLEGEISYPEYTITATMTADGKFISITHYGIGYIKATLNGSINASGELAFNAKYSDFVY